LDGIPLAINGPTDHVHLLVKLPATQSVADVSRVLKTNSSRWVHDTCPERWVFAWQTGYGAFSVSQSNIPDVLAYIARQEEHHRRMTFQEEFIAFSKRHEIEYDARYIWE
jgi:REP element-mobilizing transposase RayT